MTPNHPAPTGVKSAGMKCICNIRIWLLSLLVTTAAAAAPLPNFAGVWVPVSVTPAGTAGTGSLALPPSDLTVSQTAGAMSLSRTAFDHVTTMTYTFDGRENTNKSGAVTRVTHSRWDGSSFVIEGKMSQVTSQGYAAWTLKEVLHLNAKGHLVIEGEYIGVDGVVTRSTKEYAREK